MQKKSTAIFILLIMLSITILIVFFGLGKEKRNNIFNLDDPLAIQQEKQEATKEPEKEATPMKDILKFIDDTITDATGIYIKVYKNQFLYKNNIKNFGIDTKNNVYLEGDEYCVDLNEKIAYYVDNGKWYKRDFTDEILLNKEEYRIPTNAKQINDTKIDGADCYVLESKQKNKKYYIKKSTETLYCVSEEIDGDIYYYQITFKELKINEKIKNSALEK